MKRLKKLISIFWNKRLHIIIITIIAVIIGTIYSFYFVVPKYEAYTTFLLIKTSDANSNSSTSINLDEKNLVGTYSELVKSKEVLRKTINNLNINENEDSLRGKIVVGQIPNTQMIKIQVRDKNPVQSMKIANEVTTVFGAKVSELYKTYSVSVIDQAEEPIVPYNINHFRDILISLIIGLFISILYVFIYNLFDNTIKNSEDIENTTDLMTIVSIPYDAESNKKGGINL